MKAKKARKRLRRVESLLGTVIEKYRTKNGDVHQLLGTAKTAVSDVLSSLPKSPKKPPARAAKSGQAATAPASKGVSTPKAAVARHALTKAG